MLVNNNNITAYSQPVLNTCDLIKSDISSTGMVPPDHIEFGKFVRFSDNGQNNKNGWFIAFQNPDGSAAVSFGNWKDTHEKRFYNISGVTMTSKEKRVFSIQMKHALEKAQQKLERIQAIAAKKAKNIWDQAEPANTDHPYLKDKRIKPHIAKQAKNTLLIPVYDEAGLCSVQQIWEKNSGEFTKLFKSEGKTKNCFCVLGDIES